MSSVFNGHAGGTPLNIIDEDEEPPTEKNEFEVEWEWLACILDRFFLILSLVTLVLFVVGVIAVGMFARQYY